MSALTKKKDDTYNIPGLEKGLTVLELMSVSGSVTLQDITDNLDITTTTAYRILSTLLKMEYVMYNEKGKRYRLTRKMLRLGYQTIGEHDIMERVLPSIRSLRDKVKESVFFGVLGEEKGVFLEGAHGIHPFKFILSQGALFDLHNSAPGKAMMAYLSVNIRDEYLSKMSFDKCTQNTITTKTLYLKELNKVRELGYAMDLEETLMGVLCVGAPIFDFEKKPVGAIWISGPNTRLTDFILNDIIKELLLTTNALSRELGYE